MRSQTATAFLTSDEQTDLIRDAQTSPRTLTTTNDGKVQWTYTTTPESEAALDALTRAFLPAIRRAASTSKRLDSDDALSVVLVEFVAAVRRHDLSSPVPFSATVSTILFRAVSDHDRTSDIITVKEATAARYWRLMHRHDFDAHAAYAECQTHTIDFDPATFLAVHRAISVDSLDALRSGTDSAPLVTAQELDDASHTLVQADLIRWLFDLVTDRQEGILRARYGFDDLATENLMVEAGLRPGEVLSDVQVSEVLHLGRATVQRERVAALAVMRAAMQALVDEEESD